jgi:ribosomal protein S18 acetylase RimI-like enzyme
MTEVAIEFADGADRLALLAQLLRRYVDEQGWGSEARHTEEIETLPGEYAPPLGRAFIARDASQAALACVVLRPIAEWCAECVEMRRLYVIPEARGRGIGRRMVDATEIWARQADYKRLRLVTMPHMTEAIALYESLGFSVIEPYRPSTASDAIFMDKALG